MSLACRRSTAALLLAVLAAPCVAARPSATKLEAEILACDASGVEAMPKADAAIVEPMLAGDPPHTQSDGQVDGKAQLIRPQTGGEPRSPALERDTLSVRTSGATAIVVTGTAGIHVRPPRG